MNNDQLASAMTGLISLQRQAEKVGTLEKIKLVEVAINNAVAILGELVARELEKAESE